MIRLVACCVMLLTAAAPVATAVCEASCATRETQSSATHHSCHDAVDTAAGASIAAIHVCGHDDGLPTMLDRATVSVGAPAILPASMLPEPPVDAPHVQVAVIDSSPPTLVSHTTPLRI